MVYKFFDKKSAVSGVNAHTNNERPLDLATEKKLLEPIIRKFKKRALSSRFKDNIWGADVAEIQ